ncbi:hypothetical protein N7533_012914 [Penicillium manginii]|uniref:uncharacterized protein n=1 Tax=Penicillium manginii TaxID=203109 RepID=UPI0025489D51|nr:uncharacterized protein N7533_012914 [Penicillium manginii]KAJ5734511.1 hypothetical protein N7533_012914 [Penicillium manginii]
MSIAQAASGAPISLFRQLSFLLGQILVGSHLDSYFVFLSPGTVLRFAANSGNDSVSTIVINKAMVEVSTTEEKCTLGIANPIIEEKLFGEAPSLEVSLAP